MTETTIGSVAMGDSGERGAAMATVRDHIENAIRLMRRGAKMRLDGIPDDPTFLSSSFGPEVTAEIAHALTAALSSRPAQEAVEDTTPDMLRLAVAAVLEADKEFRSQMPDGWGGDPLTDELDGLRRIFEAQPATPSHGADTSAPNKPSDAILALLPVTAGQGVEVKHDDDVYRAAEALLGTLWQLAWSGVRTHEDNWKEMDRRFPQARWLSNALAALATPEQSKESHQGKEPMVDDRDGYYLAHGLREEDLP